MKPQKRTYAIPKVTKAVPAITASETRLSSKPFNSRLLSLFSNIINLQNRLVKDLMPKN